MANEVNGQITDAVTQANVKVLGDAPAEALAMLYQTMAHSVGLGMQNATSNQQQMNTIGQTSTTQCANSIMTLEPATSARATQNIMTGNDIASLIAQLNTVLNSNRQSGVITQ